LLSGIKGAPTNGPVTTEIYADDAFEFFQRHFLDRAIANDSGIVHENIETSMSILDLVHHRLDLLRLRYVAIDHQRILQFFGNAFRVGLVLALWVREIIDHASRAAFAEGLDHFGADAAGTASHEDNFAGEIDIGHF